MKNQINAFDEGDLKPQDVTKIATDLGVSEDEVVSMNRRMAMGGDTSLNDREKHILTERRLTDDPKTLEELSQVYGVSRERIRQIEVRAFEKLQSALIKLAGEKKLLSAA
jgi:RNA polymerase sigma-32 factor